MRESIRWFVGYMAIGFRRKRFLVGFTVFTVLLNVYFNSSLLTGYAFTGDFTRVVDLNGFVEYFVPIWNPRGSFSNLFRMSMTLIYIPIIMLNLVGINIEPITPIYFVYFTVLAVISAHSVYWLSKYIADDHSGIYNYYHATAGLFYIMSPYVVEHVPHPSIKYGYFLAPLLLLFLIRGVKENKRRYLLIAVVIWSLASSDIHWPIFGAILVYGYLFYYFAFRIRNGLRGASREFFGNGVFIAGLFSLFNSYWIVPGLLAGGTSLYGNVLSREGFRLLYRNAQPSTIVAQRGNFLLNQRYGIAPNWLQPFSSELGALLIFLAAAGITSSLCLKKNRELTYFMVMFVLSIFLSAGPWLSPNLFDWIMFEAPLHSYYAWAFRTPKFHGFTSLALAPMIAISGIQLHLFLENQRLKTRHFQLIFLVAVVISCMIANYPFMTGDFNGNAETIEIPQEYDQAADHLSKENGETRAIWGPSFTGLQTTWHTNIIGDFTSDMSPMPTFRADNGYFDYLLWNYRYRTPLTSLVQRGETSEVDEFLGATNVEYIVVHDDIPQLEQGTKSLLRQLQKDEDIELEKRIGYISIYKISAYSSRAKTTMKTVKVFGGLESVNSLSQLQEFNLNNNGVILAEQRLNRVGSPDIVIINSNSNYPGFNEERNEVYFPFQATTHNDVNDKWTKNFASSPQFKRNLARRGIPTRQHLDYNRGVVFTSGSETISNDAQPDSSDQIRAWRFEAPRQVLEWKKYTTQSDNYSLSNGNGRVEATLNESTWGWKTITSPPVRVDTGSHYRIQFGLEARKGHNIHVKIKELDQNKQPLQARRVGNTWNGDFNRETVSVEYVPRNKSTKFLQIQVWHGHNTTQPLPNRIFVDDVQIYDMSRYTEPVDLQMQVEVDEEDDYKLFSRHLENEEGGQIRVSVDGQPTTIDTADQLNRFVWREVGTYHLEPGEHTITLENVRGFNAVNLFTLVPADEYERQQRRLADELQDKTVVHLMEAESDLYRNESTAVRSDRNASNGRFVAMNQSSRVYQTVETATGGQYRLAVSGNGTFTVSLDDRTWTVDRATDGYSYLGPVTLDRGSHDLEIVTSNDTAELDVVWLYTAPGDTANQTLQDVFATDANPATVESTEKIDPTKYKVDVNASEPYMLSFAEGYDPLWVAEVQTPNGTKQIEPTPLYGVINGFWIEEPGEYTVTIRYRPQRWFYYGAAISGTTFVLSIAYLFYDWRRRRRDEWAVATHERVHARWSAVRTRGKEALVRSARRLAE